VLLQQRWQHSSSSGRGLLPAPRVGGRLPGWQHSRTGLGMREWTVVRGCHSTNGLSAPGSVACLCSKPGGEASMPYPGGHNSSSLRGTTMRTSTTSCQYHTGVLGEGRQCLGLGFTALSI